MTDEIKALEERLDRMWRWLEDGTHDDHPEWRTREAAFFSTLARYEAMVDKDREAKAA